MRSKPTPNATTTAAVRFVHGTKRNTPRIGRTSQTQGGAYAKDKPAKSQTPMRLATMLIEYASTVSR